MRLFLLPSIHIPLSLSLSVRQQILDAATSLVTLKMNRTQAMQRDIKTLEEISFLF